jgi:hypothetical protein
VSFFVRLSSLFSPLAFHFQVKKYAKNSYSCLSSHFEFNPKAKLPHVSFFSISPTFHMHRPTWTSAAFVFNLRQVPNIHVHSESRHQRKKNMSAKNKNAVKTKHSQYSILSQPSQLELHHQLGPSHPHDQQSAAPLTQSRRKPH